MPEHEDVATESTDGIPIDDKLGVIETRLAAANRELVAAIEQSTGLLASEHPRMELRNTPAELLDTYQELTQAVDAVEWTLDELADDHHNLTPRQIKTEHADRLKETYDRPVLYLALQLLEANRRKWIHGKPETNGVREVERHGLTANQREWLNELNKLSVDDQ